MSDIPEIDGVGDGGSLLYIGDWMGEHDDHIFALGGGARMNPLDTIFTSTASPVIVGAR